MLSLLALAALLVVAKLWSRIGELEQSLGEMRDSLKLLSRRVDELTGEAPVAAPSVSAPTVANAPAGRGAPPRQTITSRPGPMQAAHAPHAPVAPSAELPGTLPSEQIPPIVPPEAEPMPDRRVAERRAPEPVPAIAVNDADVGAPPVPPVPPAPPAPPAAPPPAPRPSFDWEGLIGVKLFSWIAGFALALAGVFFLRYSIDHGWLQPAVRMTIGLLVGVGLLVGCELKAARRYAATANALDAAGIAILFSTFFAAHALWGLVNAPVTFALMVLVTGVAVLLSIRRASMFIALLGLVGGFATPALLSTGQDNPFGLFGYLLILNAGLAWVAYRKRWPVLTALTLLFTTLYQWAWVSKFLTAGKLPLAAGIFLVFPLLSFAALALGGAPADGESGESDESVEGGGASRWAWLYSRTATASAALPLLFAIYFASVPAYGARFGILFGFLFCLDAGLFAIATFRGPKVLHLLGAASTVLVWATWLNGSYERGTLPPVLALVSVFVAAYLAAPLAARRLGCELTGWSARAVFAAPLLLFAFPALIALEPRTASPGLLFSVLFLLLGACAAYAVLREEGAVHFIAAFFALGAEALWSARHLRADNLLPALAIYGVFGLFYIGVPVLARRRGRVLRPRGAGGLLTLVSLALLFFMAGTSVASTALWGLALLLAILNAGLFMEAATTRVPILSIAGAVMSWLILAVWWATATVTAALVPALAVVAGFALLTLAGHVWARGRAAGAEDAAAAPVFERGAYLGLVGHLFLFFVASQPALSVPPWPLLGVLGVLQLAVGAAALYMRRGELWLAAAAVSPVVLMLWATVARIAPWPVVATLAALALAALAFAWIYLARRSGIPGEKFEAAAGAASILAQVVAVVAGAQQGAPSLGFLVATHLALVVAVLALAAIPQRRALAMAAVAPATAGVALWQITHDARADWVRQLAFAAPIYAAFLAYPLALGRRVGRSREPYLAAVLASAAFFFEARHAMLLGGFGGVIGVLPVVQGALVAVLLVQLLRIEPPAERTLGRLALVAGAALAFVTVAIPLQLEREWITIGWALEGAALAWLYRRIPHRGLLLAATGLLAVTFARLALNPAVLAYAPRGGLPILNWYLYTYLLAAAALLVAGRMLATTSDRLAPGTPRVSPALAGGGTILLFLLLNIEIADFYTAGGATLTFNFSATLAQDLTYTLGWAAFAVALLAAGIVIRSKPARVAAISLLALTVLKCFLHDLGRLGGLYRVGSFVGLALCLSLVAMALQRFVMSPKEAR